MTGTKAEQELPSSVRAGWPRFDADAYLDARRPEWQAADRAGLVRYARLSGERHAHVFVAPTATEIIAAFIRPSALHPGNRRPAETEVLPH